MKLIFLKSVNNNADTHRITLARCGAIPTWNLWMALSHLLTPMPMNTTRTKQVVVSRNAISLPSPVCLVTRFPLHALYVLVTIWKLWNFGKLCTLLLHEFVSKLLSSAEATKHIFQQCPSKLIWFFQYYALLKTISRFMVELNSSSDEVCNALEKAFLETYPHCKEVTHDELDMMPWNTTGHHSNTDGGPSDRKRRWKWWSLQRTLRETKCKINGNSRPV